MEFGKRDIYDKGLDARIGPLDDRDPIATVHTEYNEEDCLPGPFTAGNCGIEMSAAIAWKAAAAGEWAKDKRSFRLISRFFG